MLNVVQAVFHPGDILDPDPGIINGASAPLLDLDIANLFGGHAFPHRADVNLVLLVFEIAGSFLQMLVFNRRLDVHDRQFQRLEFVVVDPEPEVALVISREHDFADSGQPAKFIRQHRFDVLGQVMQRALAGDGKQNDRLIFRVGLVDGGRDGSRGKFHRAHLRLNFRQGRVHVAIDIEFEGDGGLPKLDAGRHVLKPLGCDDGLLERIDNFRFHHVGRGPRPTQVDDEDGKVDVRHLAHAETSQSDGAKDNEGRHQHPGKDRPANGEVG